MQNDKLEITREKVLEAAAKCSTAKATLQVLFPEAFENEKEIYNFGDEFRIDTWTGAPLFIGDGLAPDGLEGKCLMVGSDYKMEVQEHSGFTMLTFTKE